MWPPMASCGPNAQPESTGERGTPRPVTAFPLSPLSPLSSLQLASPPLPLQTDRQQKLANLGSTNAVVIKIWL